MQESSVIVIAFLVHSLATGWWLDELKLGEITPKDPQVVVNETLELNCTVFEDSGVNVSMLYWEDKFEQRVPDDHVIPVGERTLLFRKEITSVKEEGIYTCKKSSTNGKGEIIANTHLLVEYEAIRDVTNITCVIYDQKSELTCIWDLGLYHHPCFLRFNANLTVNQESVVTCPAIIKNDDCKRMSQISCTWTSADATIGVLENKIDLEIRNSKYDVSSKLFQRTYYRQEITKYGPTSDINATIQEMTTCACANITWEGIPGLIRTSSKLTIHSEWDSKVYTTENETLSVCDLIPDSKYNITVQVKHPNGLYYSDIKQSSFSTCSAAPSRAPTVFRSGFSSGTCYNTLYRNVTVYWKKIPRKYQNGKLTKYILAYDGASVSVSAENSHGQLQTPCARNSSISVYGCNEIGCSPNSTSAIPQFKDSFAPTKLIVEHHNTSAVELTWFGGEGQIEADIVWCTASFLCQNEINILLFKGNVTHTVLHQNEIYSSIQDVIFGVAILDKNKVSSGIRWQDPCRYKKDYEPREIRDVSLQPEPPENSLVVSWSPHLCDTSTDSNAYVHFYKIIYCQLISGDCKGTESSVSVLASANTQYMIQNLEPEKEYGIWVKASSLTREGPRSEIVTGRPTNNDLPSGATAGIVVTSLFVFALVFAGVMFIVRNVKHRLGFDEAFPIHIPEMDNKIFTDEQGKSHQYEKVEKNVSISRETESASLSTQNFANGVAQSNGVLIQMNKMSNSVNVTLRHDQLKEVKNSIKADKPASGFIEKQRNDKPKQKKELPPDYTQAVTVDQCLKENADILDYIESPELSTQNNGYVSHNGMNDDIQYEDEKRNLGTLTLNEQDTKPEQNKDCNMQNILSLNDWNETASCHALQSNISTESNMSTMNARLRQNQHVCHSEIKTADLVEESNNNGIVMMCSDYVPCNLQQAIELSVPGELKSNSISTTNPESIATIDSTNTIGYVTHSGTRICNM